eukprot:gene3688-biopygen6641
MPSEVKHSYLIMYKERRAVNVIIESDNNDSPAITGPACLNVVPNCYNFYYYNYFNYDNYYIFNHYYYFYFNYYFN